MALLIASALMPFIKGTSIKNNLVQVDRALSIAPTKEEYPALLYPIGPQKYQTLPHQNIYLC